MYGFASHPFAHLATTGPSSSGYAPCKPTSSSFSPFGYTSSPRYVCQDDSHAASSDDDDDDDDDDLDSYYAYLDAARRAREHRKLEEAQARRHAQEQAYIRVKAQAEHEAKVRAAIEARQRHEAQQEQKYKRRQHQAALEYRARQEAEYRARQEAELRARKEAEYRAAMEAQAHARAQARAHAQARAQQEQKAREGEAQRVRRIQAAYQEDLLKHLFGSYISHRDEQTPSAPAPRPSSIPASSKAATVPAPQTQPQLERRPSVNSDHSSSSTMSREEAVTVIQTLAKQQINLRRRIGTVNSLRSRFATLKSEYEQPESLVFNIEKSTPSTPVLAYTPVNRPLQAYEEALTRLLTELDEISSQGSEKVKKERKALATDVQKELDRLDGVKVVEWARQSVQQRQENVERPAAETKETADGPATEDISAAADATEAAVEPNLTESVTAITGEAAMEQSTDEDNMEVDVTNGDGSSHETPALDVQAKTIEPPSPPLVPTVDTHHEHPDVDSDSTDTELPVSDPIDTLPSALAATQELDLQPDAEPANIEPQQGATGEHPKHGPLDEAAPVETNIHPSPSTPAAADNLASIPPFVSDAAASTGKASEEPSIYPFSIPGLISQIVRESYEGMDEDEKRTAEDEMGSESSGSETSFEML